MDAPAATTAARCQMSEAEARAPGPVRAHNKSGKAALSVTDADAVQVLAWARMVDDALVQQQEGLCATPCQLYPTGDGRITVAGKKVCYAYQAVAHRKFGRDELSKVAAAKSQDDLVISHLCGTRNCVVESHLILESKRLNDERTHCHYTMANVVRKSGRAGLAAAMDLGLCDHNPHCGSEHTPVSKYFPCCGRKREMRTRCTTVNCRERLESL